MKNFQLVPQIHTFNNFKDFADEFKIGEGDLVLTQEFIYEPFMKYLNLKADFIFQEKYGVGEPSDEMINKIIAAMPNKKVKRIVGIGGGTVIDISKLMVFKDVKNCLDLFEKKVPFIRDKELIIIPTTCGTGSEVTNISIAEIKSKYTKMGLATDELFANQAVLIPELIKGLPFKFFVASSIDALIHAIESFVSPKASVYTEIFSVKAIEMIMKGYMEIIEKGEDHRQNLLKEFSTASNYAGIAFANAGVGAVHAMSYPLGGVYHVAHGEANYELFTEVFKMYSKKNPNGKIKEINTLLANVLGLSHGEDVYKEIENVLNKLLMKKPLKEFGMKKEEIKLFTDSVIESQQRLLVNNYVALSREEMIEIYTNLY
ncbi:4-hydroxybutyrate dehydrogenase [Clostridium estertheticum]|uniref:4-hydroxybutyrate dehydrogenase n=1 Tax=Clostridium estertheticum TaxID=238834 RepID=UPI001C0AC8A2|nr:4-hydroxybutyrate dehydrogenase [Clostridium estertheticum]MBU3198931.1 4-hydroxybutyrate dehydrogenase [Clostridium estertheticum]WAG64242.1 4-hydroxybutyrate dehydrogenase [Clostridium estertheticum]